MTETQIQTPPAAPEAPEAPVVTPMSPDEELKMLKDRARQMGINVGNAGLDALRKKVADKMNGVAEEPSQEDETEEADALVAEKPKTRLQIEQETRERMKREKMALVRCRITNLNPAKAEIPGEIITVGNRFLGTVKKYIPFGSATDGGYHIPRCIYDDLISRKYQSIKTRKVKGQQVQDRRILPEYSVEIMAPLTREELDELATRQAAAERLGAND